VRSPRRATSCGRRANLGDVLGRFKTIVVPEINLGQLLMLIRGQFPVDAIGINEVRGKMFRVDTLVEKTLEILNR
jgi:2-oxoglutarate ferredoxin oxidoreductase subunit alpha